MKLILSPEDEYLREDALFIINYFNSKKLNTYSYVLRVVAWSSTTLFYIHEKGEDNSTTVYIPLKANNFIKFVRSLDEFIAIAQKNERRRKWQTVK